jgi:hypothetical protein
MGFMGISNTGDPMAADDPTAAGGAQPQVDIIGTTGPGDRPPDRGEGPLGGGPGGKAVGGSRGPFDFGWHTRKHSWHNPGDEPVDYSGDAFKMSKGPRFPGGGAPWNDMGFDPAEARGLMRHARRGEMQFDPLGYHVGAAGGDTSASGYWHPYESESFLHATPPDQQYQNIQAAKQRETAQQRGAPRLQTALRMYAARRGKRPNPRRPVSLIG